MGAGVNDTAFCHRVVKGLSKRGLPDLVGDRYVAITNRLVNGLGIGGNVFNVIAHGFENAADYIRHDHLA